MKIVMGNIWQFANSSVIGIPTNGYLTRNGTGVLGRGLALQAKQRYPDIAYQFGYHLMRHGHCVGWMLRMPIKLLSIPVKPCNVKIETIEDQNKILPSVAFQYPVGSTVPGFHAKAQPEIIERSLIELIAFMGKENIPSVHIPLLGCGNGGLDAEKDLFPIFERVPLPDTITLVVPGKDEVNYV